jgi:tRNA (guanine-N7-)-methyltransferase
VRKSKRLPLEALQPYLLDLPDPVRGLDLHEVFGNDNPVEVEVGFGKGSFLLTAAPARPEVNFLGVEIERKYQLYTATRIAKRTLRNVRLVRADARQFLRGCLADQCVSAVHVYFPDPWWKKRHHKRRVFTAAFAGECARVLRPGGRLHVATDVEEYFGIMTGLVTQVPQMRRVPLPESGEPEHMTNFERKAREAGLAVFRAGFERV